MRLKRRVDNRGGQARLPWVLIWDYRSRSGEMIAADFKDGSGDLLHLEHRLDTNTRVVNWSSLQPIVTVARKLGELADKNDQALLVVGEHQRTTHDPRNLGSIVARLGGVRLMRLDRSDTTIIWGREVEYRGGQDDLLVLAGNWAEAEEIAIHMGAGIAEGEVLRLVANTPRLAPPSTSARDT